MELASSDSDKPSPTRAAQYVRMSTEHQQYSTSNQADVILEYATRRNYEIVKTYADDGKSGLRIEGRDSLRRLIDDVERGDCGFDAILVYDVSRWGRFQDSDESAYYEYICKRAGIHVVYCAEQFENDGSPISTIVKGVKRAMAGEYSRELSSKVFKGQCRLIQLGFRQGGTAGYGLRRMLLDQNGENKGILRRGEHKSLQTDRVTLVHGPAEEVQTVRRIYRLFAHEGLREANIAELLEREAITTETGRPWNRGIVHQILTNEKYIGNNVYNHVSFKLKRKRVRNTPDMWIRADEAFEPIVDASDFFIAQGIIQERHRVYSNDDLIRFLKSLLDKFARLSAALIDGTDGMPSSGAYRTRFGSLIEAYRAAGYAVDRDYEYLHVNRRLRAMYPDVISDTLGRLQEIGAEVTCDNSTDYLHINGEYTASIVLTRAKQTTNGSLRWRVSINELHPPDITIVVRMDAANEQATDYLMLPLIDIPPGRLLLRNVNGLQIDGYSFESMNYLIEMSSRVRIEVQS